MVKARYVHKLSNCRIRRSDYDVIIMRLLWNSCPQKIPSQLNWVDHSFLEGHTTTNNIAVNARLATKLKENSLLGIVICIQRFHEQARIEYHFSYKFPLQLKWCSLNQPCLEYVIFGVSSVRLGYVKIYNYKTKL